MCHESTSIALAESIGIGKASVSIEDVYHAKLIIVAGQNPGTNHPRMLSALEIAKKNGAKIISINPLREAGLVRFKNPAGAQWGGRQGHQVVRPAPADQAERRPGAVPGASARCWCSGTPSTTTSSTGTPPVSNAGRRTSAPSTGTLVAETTGLTRAQITEARASCSRDSDATVFCWAMGLTQHRNGVATIKEVANLAFAQGNIGKPGAGLVPGPRPLQRAGRPHDGHLGAAARSTSWTPCRRSSASIRRARTGWTPSIRSARCGTARRTSSSASAAISCRPRPDTDVVIEAMQQGPDDGAHLDQAEPLAPGLRRNRADPAHQGPHREGHPGQRPAVDLGGGLHLLGALLARTAANRPVRI